eukprot:1752698-Rhodomonas_salina.1
MAKAKVSLALSLASAAASSSMPVKKAATLSSNAMAGSANGTFATASVTFSARSSDSPIATSEMMQKAISSTTCAPSIPRQWRAACCECERRDPDLHGIPDDVQQLLVVDGHFKAAFVGDQGGEDGNIEEDKECDQD